MLAALTRASMRPRQIASEYSNWPSSSRGPITSFNEAEANSLGILHESGRKLSRKD